MNLSIASPSIEDKPPENVPLVVLDVSELIRIFVILKTNFEILNSVLVLSALANGLTTFGRSRNSPIHRNSYIDSASYSYTSSHNYNSDNYNSDTYNSVEKEWNSLPAIYFFKINSQKALVVENPETDYIIPHWTMLSLERNFVFPTIQNYKCFPENRATQLEFVKGNPILRQFPEEFLKNTAIGSLKWSNADLTKISPETFRHAYALKSLYLSGNELTELPSNVFTGMPALQHVDLSNNRIETIADDAFNKDETNPFDAFPDDCKAEYVNPQQAISAHLYIQVLKLRNNRLTHLKEGWFKALPELNKLDLGQNQLQAIYSSIHFPSNANLDTLHLDYNNITDLTKMQFKIRLNILNLAHNPVNDPKVVFADASYTNVQNINAERCIVQTNCNNLDVSNNSLTSIEADDPNAEYQLEIINLNHNLLTSLRNLSVFNQLMTLWATNNRLEHFDAVTFEALPNLQTLHLSNNRLKDVQFSVTIRHLRSFNVDGNELTTIDTNIGRVVPELKTIQLHDNNWECQYLTTALLLIHADGIQVVNGTLGKKQYDSSVRGVGCFYGAPKKSSINEPTVDYAVIEREIRQEARDLINHRLDKLQVVIQELIRKVTEKQTNAINEKIDEYNSLKNPERNMIVKNEEEEDE